MPKPANILIHEFDPAIQSVTDDDGDEVLGFYYEFIDENETPIGYMIGPYRDGPSAEKAALRAWKLNDF